MQDFAYFQEQDSDQFSFFRIPKVMFSDERFEELSSEAKILYGIMLDRVGLSRKNGCELPEVSATKPKLDI